MIDKENRFCSNQNNMGVESKIKQFAFPESQYFKTEFGKKQIYLHHTVSGGDATGDLNYWKNTPDRVATCVVIERDGDIIQCFDDKYWAYHLGIDVKHATKYGSKLVPQPNDTLNKQSIGIEIDSWGGLIKNTLGQWCVPKWDNILKINIPTSTVIPTENVVEYPNGFRGWKGFEKYTYAQIHSTKEYLGYLCKKYNIDKTYHDDIWDICPRAYNLDSGIFTHCSVRQDKSDIHPYNEMITALKNI